MAFDVKSTLRSVESYLQASGYHAAGVQIGEPKQPPQTGFSAAVFMSHVGVATLTLTTTIELHVATVRVYRDMLAEPQENVELDMAVIVSKVMSDLAGEYDLGATIRNVDIGGQYGTPLSARWGYLDVSGVMYRIADITLPLIVDDSATLVA